MQATLIQPWARCARALLSVMAMAWLLLQGLPVAAQFSGSTATAPVAVPAFRQANNVAVLTVHGMIDHVTLASLERRMKQARQDGADAVVLDIDTLGGEMTATLDICNLLKDRNDTPANVVAWIHPKAYSAGTIIALACREIVVAPGSTFGDAAPINMLGQQLSPTEREKVLAPLRTEIIDSARRNHYDEKLVQAFIMLGQELWMIEHVATGERTFVDRGEYRAVFGEDPPAQFGAPATATLTPNAPRLLPWIDTAIPRASDTAGITDPDQLQRQAEFEQTLPPARAPLTVADRDQWRPIMQATDGSLLTVKPDQARYFGLAAAIISNDAELKSFFGAQNLARYDQTWSENLVRFLVSWPVRAVLIVIFLVALFVELAMPGFGVFGAASLVALLILIGAPALAGLAQWWDILLIVVGLLMVAAELFIVPGVGFAGILGVLSLLIGLVGTFVAGDLSSPQTQQDLWIGLATTLFSVFAAGVIIWFVSRQVHSLPIINKLILNTELKSETRAAGASAADTSLLQAMSSSQRGLQAGDLGVAQTDLRPAGRATFDGRLVDVQSVGTFIEQGTRVRVLNVGRHVIEVEEASE